MKYPNRLRVLRAERRITQLDLAIKADIYEKRFWRIENGYAAATPDEQKRIARALKVQPSDAFSYAEAVA